MPCDPLEPRVRVPKRVRGPALILLVYAATFIFPFYLDVQKWSVGMTGGRVWVGWPSRVPLMPTAISWDFNPHFNLFSALAPSARHQPYLIVSIPLWPFVIGTVLWLARNRERPHACPTCGYDLRGAVWDRCSECGSSIATGQAPGNHPPRTAPTNRPRRTPRILAIVLLYVVSLAAEGGFGIARWPFQLDNGVLEIGLRRWYFIRPNGGYLIPSPQFDLMDAIAPGRGDGAIRIPLWPLALLAIVWSMRTRPGRADARDSGAERPPPFNRLTPPRR